VKRSPLKRTTPLARGTARLKARRRPAVGTVEQREMFKLQVCHPGAVCAVVDDGPCEGELQSHHVVSQQWLRKRFAEFGPVGLALMLWEPANGMPLCRRHHDRHTLATRRVPLSALTPEHCEFIHNVGADLHVERTYRKEAA